MAELAMIVSAVCGVEAAALGLVSLMLRHERQIFAVTMTITVVLAAASIITGGLYENP